MKKSKILIFVATMIASLGVMFAQVASNACPPLLAYQPKTPKSLIKE